ncbi:glutamate--tRNA ligase [Dyadobacter sediminis]|uniref:Glutamate--tRNA ligase n=1 Tax=Dyadobacter sediminis TaxID=1493691 RepID=A0A5R9K8D1_9BACT|nr:glutamate--tRNA ligase [Dyadobacter sediminis]TLU90367.1 glutamate--tRNA ligase [Dyadobacter sediminis]GGC07214.1 glutamate--tRNA ligase [Dyadobacter sediminis]
MNNQPVRVRFAPSPTGPLHAGGVRTALYNYLFARQQGGQMLLRIEDTDQNRYVPGAEGYILEALKWLGINIDEGPQQGGPNAPYRQSERKEMYMEYAEKLIREGKAYYAFDTAEELDDMRKRLEAAKVAAAQYNAITRMEMTNSLTLSAEETKSRLESGMPYVIRMKIMPKEDIRFNDLIRGWIVVHSSQIDDKVLMKSDGMPTYHLANIVDDHLMGITHVIRGEEWLPSAPLHVLLYRYLGWESTMPQFAHLPLLLKPDGNGKLSKRDADLGGFPIFPLEWTDPVSGDKAKGFREEGYLPQATANFLALLGWNAGTEQELFSMEEMIRTFSFDRVHKAGARFDIQKANWFNQQYLKQLDDQEIIAQLKPLYQQKSIPVNEDQITQIVHLLKDRVHFVREIAEESLFLFHAPETYDQDVAVKKWNEEAANAIAGFKDALAGFEGSFLAHDIKDKLSATMENLGIKMGKIMQALRLAVTGAGAGPDLMIIMEILGKEEVIRRLENALDRLPAQIRLA